MEKEYQEIELPEIKQGITLKIIPPFQEFKIQYSKNIDNNIVIKQNKIIFANLYFIVNNPSIIPEFNRNEGFFYKILENRNEYYY